MIKRKIMTILRRPETYPLIHETKILPQSFADRIIEDIALTQGYVLEKISSKTYNHVKLDTLPFIESVDLGFRDFIPLNKKQRHFSIPLNGICIMEIYPIPIPFSAPLPQSHFIEIKDELTQYIKKQTKSKNITIYYSHGEIQKTTFRQLKWTLRSSLYYWWKQAFNKKIDWDKIPHEWFVKYAGVWYIGIYEEKE